MKEIKIFEVGGSIRNELLGRPAKDKDYAVLAPSYEAMKEHIIANGGKIYQERPQFVSIKARFPGIGDTDFTMARKESFYTDSRHPDSVTPAASIEEDLCRRDFTMNAIAREVGTTNLIDPYEGQKDIKTKIIKTVGKASDRFSEDRLRIFRAIRFACQLDFVLSDDVSETINNFGIEEITKGVTKEMVQVEMAKAFGADTMSAIEWLNKHPDLFNVMDNHGIWLMPTLKSK